MQKEIGKVTEVYVGFEDHGLFCYMVTFDFGGSGQSYGPFAIGSNSTAIARTKDEELGWSDAALSRGMQKLIELHEFFNVETLKKAVGMYVEVERDSSWGRIECLRRLPVDGGKVFSMEKTDG